MRERSRTRAWNNVILRRGGRLYLAGELLRVRLSDGQEGMSTTCTSAIRTQDGGGNYVEDGYERAQVNARCCMSDHSMKRVFLEKDSEPVAVCYAADTANSIGPCVYLTSCDNERARGMEQGGESGRPATIHTLDTSAGTTFPIPDIACVSMMSSIPLHRCMVHASRAGCGSETRYYAHSAMPSMESISSLGHGELASRPSQSVR
jgi:hypothetical protein